MATNETNSENHTEEEVQLAQLAAEDKQIFFNSFNSLYGEIDEYKKR